jgi:hypothetical protein
MEQHKNFWEISVTIKDVLTWVFANVDKPLEI